MEIYSPADAIGALMNLPLSHEKIHALLKDLSREKSDLDFDEWVKQWEESIESLSTAALRLRTMKAVVDGEINPQDGV